jgi:hypothetical protein
MTTVTDTQLAQALADVDFLMKTIAPLMPRDVAACGDAERESIISEFHALSDDCAEELTAERQQLRTQIAQLREEVTVLRRALNGVLAKTGETIKAAASVSAGARCEVFAGAGRTLDEARIDAEIDRMFKDFKD